jgi:hypothetical protein
VTRLQAEQSGVQIPTGVMDSSLLQIVQTGRQSHPASYSVGTGGLSWGQSNQGPNVLLSAHSSDILILCLSLNGTGEVSHPFKTSSKTGEFSTEIHFVILIIAFSKRSWEDT